MPELIPHAPDNPEFARVIELRQLRDLDAFAFDIAPTAGRGARARAAPRRRRRSASSASPAG